MCLLGKVWCLLSLDDSILPFIMPKQSFLATPELDLGGSLKKGSVFIVARKGWTLPWDGIACPPVAEPTLSEGSSKMVQVVNVEPPNSFGMHTSDQFLKQMPPLLPSLPAPFQRKFPRSLS
jgi:hypothetical protein